MNGELELHEAAERELTRGDATHVRLASSALVDRLLGAHPATPHVVFLPVATLCLFAAYRGGAPWAVLVALVPGGVLLWTLVEYVLHRFGLHLPRRTHAWRVVFTLVHGHHHVAPRDVRRLVAPLPMAIALLALVHGLLGLALPPTAALPLFAGVVLGYCIYEWTHFVAHHGRPRSALLRAMARHHLAHHFDTPDARFGISSPLWDHVFGTSRGTRTKP